MSKITSGSVRRVTRVFGFICASLLLLLSAAACSAGGTAEPPAETAAPASDAGENTGAAEAEMPDGIEIPVLKDKEAFALSSGDLHGGVWDTVITNTKNGSNVSPQLSWDAVDGAECYAIYMVDTSASCWIHWRSNDVTLTELPRGWAPAKEYVGPYPPGGTHCYEIYVFALKHRAEKLKGSFDSADPKFAEHAAALDMNEDGGGNIIAYGHISGTYTSGS